MATKNKNVDSIVAPEKTKVEKKTQKNEEPLLSIIEPVEKQKIKLNKEKAEKPKKPKFKLKKHHKIIAASCSILVFTLIFVAVVGGAAYAHQAYYENKVFPGVIVWGEEVGGLSVAEVQDLINNKIENYAVTIQGPDQNYVATATDLGITFDSESMALGAYTRGRSGSFWDDYLTRARLLASVIPWDKWQSLIRANDLVISPSYSLDEATLGAYLQVVAENINITAQDSKIVITEEKVTLTPAIYGRQVNTDELRNQVRESLSGFTSDEITVVTDMVTPDIIDTAAEEVMIQAENVMQRPVILTYNGTEYRPSQDAVASWISFTKNAGDTEYTLVIDKTKMSNYFDYLESKINIAAVSRKVRITNGTEQTEISAGADGLAVDTTLLGQEIADKLPNQASVTLTIPTYVVKYTTKYERVVIADWDKYIDVNISSQTMTACEKGGVNCRSWSITTGNDSHSTPTGTFLVLGKSSNFYMTGGTVGVDYYKVWVDRAVWFTSAGHAIHDAAWRNGVFGGQDYHRNGSHGCVNSPDDAATYIYNWADVGTPIIIHY